MKLLIAIYLVLGITNISIGQENLVPATYKVIKEIQGDLDKDGIEEKVVVYDMTDSLDEEEGTRREIIIFKKQNQDWNIWQRSANAIGGSNSGGMMGDPFGYIEIKKGILIIQQNGGSSWKWGTEDKYRFQNNTFELIGHSISYGKLCEYWLSIDYNLMTGKVEVKKEYEKCDDDGEGQVIFKKENENFVRKWKSEITLKNRRGIERKIISPKYKHELYF